MNTVLNPAFSLLHPASHLQNRTTKSFDMVSGNELGLYSGFNCSPSLLQNNSLKLNPSHFSSQNFLNSRCNLPSFSTLQMRFDSLCQQQKSQNVINSSVNAHNAVFPRTNPLLTALQNNHSCNNRPSPIHCQNLRNTTSLCVDLSAPVFRQTGIKAYSFEGLKSQSPTESNASSTTLSVESALKIKSEISDSCSSSRLSDDEVDKVFSTKRIKKQNICGHHDKEHYAKGLCNHCYRRFGRNKKPWACSHQKLYANGLCQRCYTGKYKKQRAIERKNLANIKNTNNINHYNNDNSNLSML